ncbi:hypothetical protein [Flavobacterium sp.]|uniref:hypothetical protein n=1 Tax=Flavobacterium sp. TaxID=239 RepID=UPI0025DD44CA|nr:hypothetical protein [Flavobacterium sp.]
MKKIVVLGLAFVLFCLASSLVLVSCQNKKVLLPHANETITADVKNQSSVYFFFKTEEKDTLIEVNQSNLLSSGNRVFNIDRRLSLRKVIMEIKRLQDKKEASENYFSYTDTIKKAIAFLPFTKVKYKLEKPDFNVVYFYLDRNDLVHFKDEVFSKNELLTFLNKKSVAASVIVFAYDKGMSFEKYIEYQFFIKNLHINQKGIVINTNSEYIY